MAAVACDVTGGGNTRLFSGSYGHDDDGMARRGADGASVRPRVRRYTPDSDEPLSGNAIVTQLSGEVKIGRSVTVDVNATHSLTLRVVSLDLPGLEWDSVDCPDNSEGEGDVRDVVCTGVRCAVVVCVCECGAP